MQNNSAAWGNSLQQGAQASCSEQGQAHRQRCQTRSCICSTQAPAVPHKGYNEISLTQMLIKECRDIPGQGNDNPAMCFHCWCRSTNPTAIQRWQRAIGHWEMTQSCIKGGLGWILGKISLLKEWSSIGRLPRKWWSYQLWVEMIYHGMVYWVWWYSVQGWTSWAWRSSPTLINAWILWLLLVIIYYKPTSTDP